jgi:hypothetical protein
MYRKQKQCLVRSIFRFFFQMKKTSAHKVQSPKVTKPRLQIPRSPIGLVVGSCTSHPGVLGSIPKREEPGKTGESRHGWAPDPPMVGIRSPIGLVVGSCTSHPGVLGPIPKREEPGKTGAPCVKVPGSSRVPVCDEQTRPHRPRLVVSHSTCPPLSSPPHANSFVIGPAVIKHTHKKRAKMK